MVRTNYKLCLSPEGNQSRFVDVGLKAFLDVGIRMGSGNLVNFLVSSLNVSSDGIGFSCQLSEWPTQEQARSCPYVIRGGDFFEVYIKFSTFNFQYFRKRAVLVLSDTKSGGWGALAMLVGEL